MFMQAFFTHTYPRRPVRRDDIFREQYTGKYTGIFAELYDGLFDNFTEDIEFYTKLAKNINTPVLDLCCGTGRLCLPLAKAGHKVVAVDSQQDMLNILQDKMKKEKQEVRNNIQIVKRDIRKLKLSVHHGFELILVSFNSFLHLFTQEDQLIVLRNIRKHIGNKGLLVIDVNFPNVERMLEDDGKMKFFYNVNNTLKKTIIEYYSSKYNFSNQTEEVSIIIEELSPDGTVRKFLTNDTLCFVFPREIKLLLELADFDLIDVLCSYKGEKFNYKDNVEFLIYLACPKSQK